MFKAKIVNGTPIETDKTKPLWFKVNELPYESMWKMIGYGFYCFLKGKSFMESFGLTRIILNYWTIK